MSIQMNDPAGWPQRWGQYGWRWLESTKRLQAESFGVDYAELTGERLADYVLMNAYAIVDELAEAMAEIQWKPWARDRGAVNRSAMASELVDLAHFLANIAVAIGITDEEWCGIYREKQARNRARQMMPGGYDARATKCTSCRRELDKDDAVIEVMAQSKMVYKCAACGCDITELVTLGPSSPFW